jgi:hypothetical protein
MNSETQTQIEQIIVSKFRQQYLEGNSDAIYHAISNIIEKKGLVDQELRQELVNVSSDRWPISKENKDRIITLLKQYEPKGLKELILLNVIRAPYIIEKKGGGYNDLSEIKAREIAAAIKDNIEEFYLVLEVLQTGEQRQTYNFANELGKIVKDKKQIIHSAVEALNQVPSESQNPSLIMGLASGIGNDDETRNIIDRLLSLPNISFHAIRLTRFLKITLSDTIKFRTLIEENPKYVQELQYLNVDSLSVEELKNYLDWMMSLGNAGIWMSIDTAYNVIRNNDARWGDIKTLIRPLIFKSGIITSDANSLTIHAYEELAVRLIKEESDETLLDFLTSEILKASSQSYFRVEFLIQNLLSQLLENQWDVVWPKIGKALIINDDGSSYNIINLLKDYRQFNSDKLLHWAKNNQPDGPYYLISFMDFESKDENGNSSFPPIINAILDDYGDDKRILDELSNRLHSFSTVGTAMPIFRGRKKMVETLLKHPNKNVRAFAEREVRYFEQDIARETTHNENYNLGEF